jgi:hypothetical protein
VRLWGLILGLIGSISLCTAETPIRLAILADPTLEKEADLLSVRLSKTPQIELLERSQIRKVLDEQKMSASGLSASSSLKIGKLLKSDGLLILKVEKAEDQSVLALRMVAVDPGFITASSYEEYPLKNQEDWEIGIEKLVTESKEKLSVSRSEAVPVTLLDFRTQVSNQKIEALESSINLLLQRRMMQQKEVFVLERKRMESLDWEKELTAETQKFWTAGAVIDGTIELKGEEAVINVKLENGGVKFPPIQVQGPQAEVAKIVDSLVSKILPQLQKEFGALPPWDPLVEARKLQLECYSARCAGLFELSRGYADAVWALGLRDDKSRRYRIYAYCRETFPSRVSTYNWYPNWKTFNLKKEPHRIQTACRMMELLQSQFSNQSLEPKDLENDAFFLGAVMLEGCYFYQLHKTYPEQVSELRRLARETYNNPHYPWDKKIKISIASRYGAYWCESPDEVIDLYQKIFPTDQETATNGAIYFLDQHKLPFNDPVDTYFPKRELIPLWKEQERSTLILKIESLAQWFCSSKSIEHQFIGWKLKERLAYSPPAKTIARTNINQFLWNQRERIVERLNLEEKTRYDHALHTFFDHYFMSEKMNPNMVDYILRNTNGTSGLYLVERITNNSKDYSKEDLRNCLEAFQIYKKSRTYANDSERRVLSTTEEKIKRSLPENQNEELFLSVTGRVVPDVSAKWHEFHLKSDTNKLMGMINSSGNIVLSDLGKNSSEKPIPGPKIERNLLYVNEPIEFSFSENYIAFSFASHIYVFDRRSQKWTSYPLSLYHCDSLFLVNDELYFGESSYQSDISLRSSNPDYNSAFAEKMNRKNNTAGALSMISLNSGETKVLCSNRSKDGKGSLDNCDPYFIRGIYKEDEDHLLIWAMNNNRPGYAMTGDFYRLRLSTNESKKLINTGSTWRNHASNRYLTFFTRHDSPNVFAWDLQNKCPIKLLNDEYSSSSRWMGNPLWNIPNPFITGYLQGAFFNGSVLYLFERSYIDNKTTDRLWVFEKNHLDPQVVTLKYNDIEQTTNDAGNDIEFLEDGIAIQKGIGYYFVPFQKILSVLKTPEEILARQPQSPPLNETSLLQFIPVSIDPEDPTFAFNTFDDFKKSLGLSISKKFIRLWDLENTASKCILKIPNQGSAVHDIDLKTPIITFNDNIAFAYHRDLYICDIQNQTWKKYQLHLDGCDSLFFKNNVIYIGESTWTQSASSKTIVTSAFSSLNPIKGEQELIFSSQSKKESSFLNSGNPKYIARIFDKNETTLILDIIQNNDEQFEREEFLCPFNLLEKN